MANGKKINALKYLPLVSQISISFAVNIFVAVAIGYYLDLWLGLPGIFLLIFCFLGFFSGLKSIYTLIMKFDKKGE